MNEPNGSTGTAGAGWRDEILREFTPGVARLTVVDDPDGLLAETGMVEALRARGFEVIPVADRVAFRYFWESRYRSRRDPGELADVVAVFTAARHEHVVPYDLLQIVAGLQTEVVDQRPRQPHAQAVAPLRHQHAASWISLSSQDIIEFQRASLRPFAALRSGSYLKT